MPTTTTTRSPTHPDNLARREIGYVTAPNRDSEWIEKQLKFLDFLFTLLSKGDWIPPRWKWKDQFNPDIDFALQVWIGMLLSVQAPDEKVVECMEIIEQNGLLSLEALSKINIGKLAKLLPVTFNNRKAKALVNGSKLILEKHNGEVPKDRASLEKLPGIGSKLSGCILSEAFGIDTLSNIDSHMFFILRSYMQWADPEDKRAKQVGERIATWLPQEHWKLLNPVIAGLGQVLSRMKVGKKKTKKTESKMAKMRQFLLDAQAVGGPELASLIYQIFVTCYNNGNGDGLSSDGLSSDIPVMGLIFIQDNKGRTIRKSLRIRGQLATAAQQF